MKKIKQKKSVYVILRYDKFHESNDIETCLTVKEVVTDEEIAKSEVDRLNKLNSTKDCLYFYQYSRLIQAENTENRK